VVAQADGQSLGHFAAVLAAAEAGVSVGGLEGEDGLEGIAGGKGAELGRSVAGGVERANEGAHAGAGDTVNGDVIVFKPLEDADVGEA
jgi:hypothetical protein